MGLMKAAFGLVRKSGFDLIHSQGLTSGICCVPPALLTGTSHLLTLHDVFTKGQFVGARGLLKKLALTVGLAAVDRIHCVSHDARENLDSELPALRLMRRSEPTVILNGIASAPFADASPRDLRAEFGISDETFLIGFLGRFMNQKGFADLVSAIEIVRSRPGLPRTPLVLCFSQEDGFIREEREAIEPKLSTASLGFFHL